MTRTKFVALTRDEEKALALRAKLGDRSAVNTLVERNLPFVILVAKKYQCRGVEMDDLIAEGNLGLITAAEKFDPGHNTRFITYAFHWVTQKIRAAIRQASAVHIPPKAWDSGVRANAISLFDKGESGDKKPIAARLEQTMFEAPDAEKVEAVAWARYLVSRLDEPRDRQIIRARYGFDGEELTLAELAQILDVSKERVRQLEDRSMAELRWHVGIGPRPSHLRPRDIAAQKFCPYSPPVHVGSFPPMRG